MTILVVCLTAIATVVLSAWQDAIPERYRADPYLSD